MAQAQATNSIQSDYMEQFAKSQALSDRANQAIAGGIAHDGRFTRPFPVYITHADGAHKWDVDSMRAWLKTYPIISVPLM